jgi:chitosanase
MSLITSEQKKVIDSVLSINETGKLPSPTAYSTVTILKDGAGISYGKHQSTDRSGSLDAIVMRYLDLNGTLADKLDPYLPKLNANFSTKVDPSNPPADVKALMKILSDAGKDPLMQQAQDQIFDEQYWIPALQKGQAMKLVLPLSYLALYDTSIHSGPGRIDALRKVFPERPPATGGQEKAWTVAFLNARFKWLKANSNPLVQRSADRVTAILKIASADNWNLVTPFTYRFGVVIP